MKTTFLLRTKDTAVFLSDFGFDTYDIVYYDNVMCINKRDTTSWVHEYDSLNIDNEEIIFSRVPINEFKIKHSAMYKKWSKLSHGWRSDEEKKEKEKKELELILPLHRWVGKHEINEETQSILENEVYKEYCYNCGDYFDEDEMRYIDNEGLMCCGCAKDFVLNKYNL